MMATLNKADDKIFVSECFLCYNKFKDPRILECFHTFCSDCLSDFVRDNVLEDLIECPLCGYENQIPENGVKGFERNYYIDKKPKSNPHCDVCGDRSLADTFCSECDQNYCQFCLKFHTKLQATKEHHITSIGNGGSTKVTTKVMCQIHRKEEVKYFCDECKELVCTDCNMTTHKTHVSQEIKPTAEKFRSDLTSLLNHEEYDAFLKELNEEKSRLRKEKNINRDNKDSTLVSFDEQTNALQHAVDEIRKDIMGQIVDAGGKNTENLSNRSKLLEIKFRSFAALYYFSKLLLEQADDTEIVANAIKLQNRLSDLKTEGLPVNADTGKCLFVKGNIDTEALRDMFGKVKFSNADKASTQIVTSFPCRHNYVISGIAPVSASMAWVTFGSEGLLGLYDIGGKCKKSILLEQQVDDITVSNDGAIFASTNSDRNIIKIQKEHNKTYYRSDLCTRGLCFDTRRNKLFAAITAKDTFFNMKKDDRCNVIQIKEENDSNHINITNKLSYPTRIAIMPDERIIISDWIDCAVIFLDKKGKIISTYKGKDKSEQDSFCPRGVCCDNDCNVYVVDIEKDCIHHLDTEGRFSKVLSLQGKVSQMWSVACDHDGKLWIGTQTGRIHVVQP